MIARATVGSTNDLARQLARAGAEHGTVVVAGEQTAGRGRRQRPWESAAGTGLYVSVVLRSPAGDECYAAALQLAAGVALAETLTPLLPEPAELLWPNDCLCVGQKLAGVLVESEATGPAIDFLVCGIGVNVNQRRHDFSPAVARLATSVAILSGSQADRTQLLADLLVSLEAWEGVARGVGIEPVIRRWLALSPSSLDSSVEVETAAGLIGGRAAGLSVRGGLLVQTSAGTQEIVTGQLVRVRRRQ